MVLVLSLGWKCLVPPVSMLSSLHCQASVPGASRGSFVDSVHEDGHCASLPGRAVSAILSHHRSSEIWAMNLLPFLPSLPSPATYFPPRYSQ